MMHCDVTKYYVFQDVNDTWGILKESFQKSPQASVLIGQKQTKKNGWQMTF